MKITHFDRALTEETRLRLQETADSLGITIWVGFDGRPIHLKMGEVPPKGAEVFKPTKLYEPAPHGGEPIAASTPDPTTP